MTKSKIFTLALTALYTLTVVAGCGLAANANFGTAQPGNNEKIASTIDADPAANERNETTPLSSEELAFYNGNTFFNGEYLNIRNQFLSSLYSAPEEIDLFQLFYCGAGLEENRSAEEEKDIILAFYGDEDAEPQCTTTKISTANIDEVLTKYMGLTLSDTSKIGLDDMLYLEKYDAYYIHHGDTNYRGLITFVSGERDGDLVRLFYNDTFFCDGNKVLAMREKDGSYLFVSNQIDVAIAGDSSSESIGSTLGEIIVPLSQTPSEVFSAEITYAGRKLSDFTLHANENVPLKLKIEPVGVEDEIIWLSSDEHIFTVTSDEVDAIKAKVTGINRGRATLTVSVGGINLECIVRVK